MSTSIVKVLIVDDSATMRAIISRVLSSDPSIDVVGEAADAFQAIEAINRLRPDVMTLDVEMPRVSGIQLLEKIMTERPMPVIMLSSTTSKGSTNAITALVKGAFHCIGKPTSGDPVAALGQLNMYVKAAAKAPLPQTQSGSRTGPKALASRRSPTSSGASASAAFKSGRLISLGASTGGVEALRVVLAEFPAGCPPTVVGQHMPENFISTLAKRLDNSLELVVKVAEDGEVCRPGHVYFAPGGGKDLTITHSARRGYQCRVVGRRDGDVHSPSVDRLFESVAASAGAKAIGAILTGMGRDGADGLLAMRNSGARTFGQDERSSTVYGMPRVAKERGAVEKQISLHSMGSEILSAATA